MTPIPRMAPLWTSLIIWARESRPWIFRPLLPSLAYSVLICTPRRFAYSRMTSTWLLVEYCWCSVDMRTQVAAGIGSGGVSPGVMGGWGGRT